MADDQDSAKTCKDCTQALGNKLKGLQCSFCENYYCQKCTKLKTTLFNDISKEESVLFSCVHCRIAMPAMRKMMAKIISFEQRIEKLEESMVSCDKDMVRNVILEEKEEELERDRRRLNVVIYSLPESTNPSIEQRKEEDIREVDFIINNTLNLNVTVDNVFRLGKLVPNNARPRPVRFTVKDFPAKRNVLNAASKLKNHEKYSRIYLTNDLTPVQRKAAFELREEKRRRERGGEVGLAIRKGRIVKLPPYKAGVGDHDYIPARDKAGVGDHDYIPARDRNSPPSRRGSFHQ
ncbi:uncharacterized protein LOC128203795 [Mya arenaria]|uniref:uncharacterized protein LOC128203795 n=1 Tax=Mya arenaria TaxID=6604 RepID=UPI0022E22625|nr:uncharacterized protein LOC128203795 [Mya arenaria]